MLVAAAILALAAAILRAGADSAIRAVVLGGQGKTFSAGADLNWMRAMAGADEAENRADAVRLAALMRTLNRDRGTTFLVVTHDNRVLTYADRIVHIEDGRIADDDIAAMRTRFEMGETAFV